MRDALGTLEHRGPDAQVVVDRPGALFGHTLLSIIGQQEIRQPILSADGHGLLVFNGEIYNYLELLEQDEALREVCALRPRSDSVVLVEGLRRYGAAFLERLNGMFSLAYHEESAGTTLLARDRLGIKPLYYAEQDGSLVFGSEVHAIRDLMGAEFRPDPVGFYSYVRFRRPAFARSFDAAVRQLPPGHRVDVDRDGLSVERYWSLQPGQRFEGTYEEARAEVGALLRDSVSLRMRSDHGFCTFLSGGLDSSLLTALAVEEKGSVDSYSIGIAGCEALDESRWSTAVAEHLGTRHHAYALGEKEFRSRHEQLVTRMAEPAGVPNQVALFALSDELSREHRVVLSGEGADELFAGYGRIALLPHDWSLIEEGDGPSPAVRGELERVYGSPLPADLFSLFLRKYEYTDHAHARALLAPLLPDLDAEEARASVEGEMGELFASFDTMCPFDRGLLFFQAFHLPGLLLRADAASMACSVEARVPFLDHRLVEFANTLPFEFKTQPLRPLAELRDMTGDAISEVHDRPKAILKDLGRERLPEGVAERRKMGFPIPDSYVAPSRDASVIDPDTDPDASASYEAWTRRNLELLFPR